MLFSVTKLLSSCEFCADCRIKSREQWWCDIFLAFSRSFTIDSIESWGVLNIMQIRKWQPSPIQTIWSACNDALLPFDSAIVCDVYISADVRWKGIELLKEKLRICRCAIWLNVPLVIGAKFTETLKIISFSQLIRIYFGCWISARLKQRQRSSANKVSGGKM